MLYRLAFSALLALSALQGLNGLPTLGFDFGRKSSGCKPFKGSILDNDDWVAEVDKDGLYERHGNGVRMLLTPPSTFQTEVDENENYKFNNLAGDGPTFTYRPLVQYGKVTAKIQAPNTGGAVTALIFKSDTKDEIDFELLSNPDNAQTNYFWGKDPRTGVNGGIEEIDVTSRARTYVIDWTEDYIEWKVDNEVIRTVRKEDTFENGVYKYPTNPSQIQIGLWDGSTQAGTAKWAHGPINWKVERNIGAVITDVAVDCY